MQLVSCGRELGTKLKPTNLYHWTANETHWNNCFYFHRYHNHHHYHYYEMHKRMDMLTTTSVTVNCHHIVIVNTPCPEKKEARVFSA